MTRLVVTKLAAAQGACHPIACIVRKYGDGADGPELAGKVDQLKRATTLVAERDNVAILVRHGDSLIGEIWLDRIASRSVVGPARQQGGGEAFDVLERREDSPELRPLPPLTTDARTAIFVVIGAERTSPRVMRGHALDVLTEFKRSCPLAYAQFVPTVPAGEAGA